MRISLTIQSEPDTYSRSIANNAEGIPTLFINFRRTKLVVKAVIVLPVADRESAILALLGKREVDEESVEGPLVVRFKQAGR